MRRLRYDIFKGVSKAKTKLTIVIATVGLMVGGGGLSLAMLGTASAVQPPMATGSVGYTAYSSVQRNAAFDAHQTSVTCQGWNVSGSYQINVEYLGTLYPETLNLTQAGTTITGVDLNTIPPSSGSAFTVNSGSVSGNNVDIYATQNTSSLVVHLSGTIDPTGSMSGNWSDVSPGTRAGTWASTLGNATFVGCTGYGTFHYTDADGNWYYVNIQYVRVNGSDTWFAGPVTTGNVGAGYWLFAKVHDGGLPSSVGGDQIWGSFTTQSAAMNGVATPGTPGDGPFAITSGNLVVH